MKSSKKPSSTRGKMPEMSKSMIKGAKELQKLSSKSTPKSRKGF